MSIIIKSIKKMSSQASIWNYSLSKIGIVPTMGALHLGHKSLIKIAKKESDIVVVSIFLNPKQFNSEEDLNTYPSNIDNDIKVCRDLNVDFIFIPSLDDIYTQDHSCFVIEDFISNKSLCDQSRPGHFSGVCTIVLKLFNIIQPSIAVFGEKDAQQLRIVERMVNDLNIPVKILRAPIIREKNGLAVSSRNQILSKKEQKNASLIYLSLQKAKSLFQEGEIYAENLKNKIQLCLSENSSINIEYIAIVDDITLDPIIKITNKSLILVAVILNGVRLIDNISIEP